ncbi:hypothetical protein D9M68_218060 [compost metagenome]
MKWVLIGLGMFLFLVLAMALMIAASAKNAKLRNLHGNARFANNHELKAYEYRGEYD